MSADPRKITLFSYYRDAELRGAGLLMRLLNHLHDPDAQVKLSLHLADETRHAWLWTKRITDIGGQPQQVGDGYQSRIGLRTVPRNLIDLLALTVVVEERAHQRYLDHAARPNVDKETLEVLDEVTKDEKWLISWIKGKLDEIAANEGGPARVEAAMQKYRDIDEQVYGALLEKEREAFDGGLADAPAAH
jgi:bacterioferritin (cytochrome b1)